MRHRRLPGESWFLRLLGAMAREGEGGRRGRLLLSGRRVGWQRPLLVIVNFCVDRMHVGN